MPRVPRRADASNATATGLPTSAGRWTAGRPGPWGAHVGGHLRESGPPVGEHLGAQVEPPVTTGAPNAATRRCHRCAANRTGRSRPPQVPQNGRREHSEITAPPDLYHALRPLPRPRLLHRLRGRRSRLQSRHRPAPRTLRLRWSHPGATGILTVRAQLSTPQDLTWQQARLKTDNQTHAPDLATTRAELGHPTNLSHTPLCPAAPVSSAPCGRP